MKKGKKLLSVVLALAMVFSAISVALVAFAASPEDVVERINAFDGTTGSKATPEEIAEFESIAAEYKALTDAQKDELDITATGKLFKLAFDRGQVVKAEEAGDDFYAKYVLADEYADEVLGRTENADKAQAYWEAFCETKVTVGGKEIAIKDAKATDIQADTEGVIAAAFEKEAADYKALGAGARYLPFLYYSSSYTSGDNKGLAVYYKNFSSPYDAIKEFYDYYKAVKEAENPFTEVAPSFTDKDKYPGGYSDPQYKADKAAYDDRKAQAQSDWCVYAWEKIADIDTVLLKNVYDLGVEMVNLLERYVKDSSSVTPDELSAVYAKFEALSATDAFVFSKSNYAAYKYVDTYGLISFKDAASSVKGLVGAPRVEAFIAAVNGATEPYTREAVEKAIDAYNQVFSESYSQIPTEVMDKFEDMIANMPASEEKPVLPDWTRPDLDYPILTNDKSLGFLVKILDKIANGAFGLSGYSDLNDLLAKELYTNYTIASIPQALYPMLEQLLNDNGAGIAVSFLKLTPQKLAKVMDEEKFAKARDLFNALVPEGEKDSTACWANLDLTKVENGTFGFQDGDREGFVNALAAVLRGLTTSITSGLLAIDFANEVDVPNYVYGLYEYLIPVLETLDLDGIMSSREYTAQFNAAEGNAKGDAAILPIINPIFDFIENKLAVDPVSTLVDILPKLARLFNDNILNEQLQHIHGTLGMISSFVSSDLLKIDPSMIVGLINGMLANIQIGDVTLSLKLSDIDWALLASTAKPVVKESVSGDNAYRVGFETNKGDSFLLIFRYLFNNLTEQSNMASIKAAVKALVEDFVLSNILGQTLTTIEGMSADEALVTVCNVLEVPEFPDETDPEEPSTEEPSTEEPSTEEPSTEEPSTEEPSTEEPSTEEPSTEEPSTEEPSTEEPSTEEPSTEAPSVEDTTSEADTDTQAPANGDSMMLGAFAAVAILAGAAVVITKKRK